MGFGFWGNPVPELHAVDHLLSFAESFSGVTPFRATVYRST